MKAHDALKAARELQLLHAPKTDVMFHGTSMQPLLTEGDRVRLEEVAFEDIRIGDIITSQYEDKYPTCRVVAKSKMRVTTWCENRPARVFSVKKSKILGRVTSRDRNGDVLLSTDQEWLQLRKKALKKYRSVRLKYHFTSFFQLLFQR